MIEVFELGKVYAGGVVALDRVSFQVRPGEVYGLLGPNGAGKTTALRILSTAIRPTSGTAAIDGVDVTRDPDGARRRLGFLSGTTGLYGRLTARETLRYFGRLYGMSEEAIDARSAELFRLLGMEEFADRRCDKLSTGMKQKVNIARTILHNPPVVVFDEPTTGLDVITSRAIVELIRGCRERGKSVILSTHNMDEARRLCDRIGVIHRGRLYADGTAEEIQARTGAPDLEEAFLRLVGSEEPA
jgi:sodium transport system ATP-binding protein